MDSWLISLEVKFVQPIVRFPQMYSVSAILRTIFRHNVETKHKSESLNPKIE